MFAKNKKDLLNKLKEIEGKSIFNLIRIDSLNDGQFTRVLHKVRINDIIFINNDMQECHLNIPKMKDLEILENGFKIQNCTYELIRII